MHLPLLQSMSFWQLSPPIIVPSITPQYGLAKQLSSGFLAKWQAMPCEQAMPGMAIGPDGPEGALAGAKQSVPVSCASIEGLMAVTWPLGPETEAVMVTLPDKVSTWRS